MNASSILGRTAPNFLADIYGPLNGWQITEDNSMADFFSSLDSFWHYLWRTSIRNVRSINHWGRSCIWGMLWVLLRRR
jgi:hypothetical protein